MNIDVPINVEIAVIGDIHEHEVQFNKLIKYLHPNKNLWVVSVGDVYDKGDGPEAAERITDEFRSLQKQKIGFAVRGNHELKTIRKTPKHQLNSQLQWWNNQPLSLTFNFQNSNKLTVMHGGVTPFHTQKDIVSNTEICYVRNLDESGRMISLITTKNKDGKKEIRPEKEGGKSWHSIYDGRFGYIVAGHEPQKDGVAKFYNYSCNIDTSVYTTGILTSQIFSKSGRGELISIKG